MTNSQRKNNKGIDAYGFNKAWIAPEAQAAVYSRMLRRKRLSGKKDDFVLSHTASQPAFCRRLAKTIAAHLFPADRVLTVAEGQGHLMRALMAIGITRIEGVDICRELVEVGKAKGLNLHLANAGALPFTDGTFDALIINEAIGALGFSGPLSEARRVLKTSGRIVITSYNYAEHKAREKNSGIVKYRYILPQLIIQALKDHGFGEITTAQIPIYLSSGPEGADQMDMIVAVKT